MGERYKKLITNGKLIRIPLVTLSNFTSDYYIKYKKNVTRMDKLSSDYYGDPRYGWLIMLANQEYGSMEFEIPDGATIRIPYPLDNALSDYQDKVSEMLTSKNLIS